MFYEELWGAYSSPGVTKGYSGFAPENQYLPYISLVNTNHTVVRKLSTLDQHEALTYSFLSYARTHGETRSILNTLKQDYSAANFTPADLNLSLLDLEWSSAVTEEVEGQRDLFGSVLQVSFLVNRKPDLAKIANVDATSYTNVFEPIVSRWNSYRGSNDPKIRLGKNVPEKERLPNLNIFTDRDVVMDHDSCGRLEEKVISTELFTRDLSSAERIVNLLVNVFNHAKFTITGLPNLGLNFVQCVFEEVEPQLWKSDITFNSTSYALRANYVS